jgi:hypothetical protein
MRPARIFAVPGAIALFLAAAPSSAADAGTHPIAGTWIGESAPDHVFTVEGAEPPLTAEGAALYRANLADSQSAQPQYDRTRWCAGPGMPRIRFMPVPFEIIVNERLVGFVHGWYRWHRAVDMSGEPADPVLPQPMGYPVGHWEGDTLVIVSNGLTSDTIIDASGLPNGEEMVLEEQLRVAADGSTTRVPAPSGMAATAGCCASTWHVRQLSRTWQVAHACGRARAESPWTRARKSGRRCDGGSGSERVSAGRTKRASPYAGIDATTDCCVSTWHDRQRSRT